VTEGEWEVKRLVDVDEELGKIYFTANRESILEQHFYSVNPDGSGLLQLTSGPGWHSPQLSPTKAYFIDSYSSSKTPRKILLKTIQGETIRVMQETDMEPYLEYEFTYPEFFDFATADGVTLKGMITYHGILMRRKNTQSLLMATGWPAPRWQLTGGEEEIISGTSTWHKMDTSL
jgi:dipeptidyl-peptidase-4